MEISNAVTIPVALLAKNLQIFSFRI